MTEVISYWDLPPGNPLAQRRRRQGAGPRPLPRRRQRPRRLLHRDQGRATPARRRPDRRSPCSVGGFGPLFAEVNETIESDLVRAELIAIPITLVLLLLVFGSVVAAVAAARHRRPVGGRHVPRAAGRQRVHRGVGVRPQPHHGDGARASPSTTRCSWSAASARSCAPGTRRRRPCAAPCGPPAGPCCSAPSRWPPRCARCSCSTSPSCAASPTPAWPSSAARRPLRHRRAAGDARRPRPPHQRPHAVEAVDRRRPTRASGTAWPSTVMRRPIPITVGVIAVLVFLGSPSLRMELGPPRRPGAPAGL